ncbi:hypothetical protein T310_5307 [Rasamsonia emersonii CBS 393.64]|uniref:Uncharacterized protein n=1 Tax=Rasamsonia emersonii (strain ATCC 16479 / CBS 393.64 / IMI 116815) TaxID=1408163 RepID=A0A0F4YRF6_RASE3|nr:hypothetical protein T310_5307 [Rasamsonia emersonii CBS 393.64]KKA20665.1 hypothetical protein T310_5307 [Rasamsonia emersonii CBS 393.64]
MLVRGFGASEYLFRRLKNAYPTIDVMQPPNAWSAVVRGAVIRGLDGNQVESRRARRHYGVSCYKRYEAEHHNKNEARWDPIEEDWFVDDRMRWYVRKGESISENDPIKMSFYRVWKCKDANKITFTETLYFCNKDRAPDVYAPDILPLCTLSVDLSDVPKKLFLKYRNSKGLEYYKINYDLTMTPTSASIFFELEYDGISDGTVRAKY